MHATQNTNKAWQVKDRADVGEVHVLPLGDTSEHAERRDCACLPRVEKPTNPNDKTLIVHYSFDGREAFEYAEGAYYVRHKRDA